MIHRFSCWSVLFNRSKSVALLGFALSVGWAAPRPQPPTPKTTAELREQIEGILKKTHTPGAGVAIVRRAGPEWVAGIGLADVAAKQPVTPDTLFRIGSTSKAFVSLSILKLQGEGKLSLQDTLRSRAPDLEFSNPWEATDPVRIVNLLEHTTGWDDIGLRDYALNSPEELTLKAGLDANPKTRTSRWKPGTRFSYCNSGPAVAAYVVEKVTGQRFEDYVEQNWFQPLGMTTASYFDTAAVRSRLTKLYRKDGVTALPYWHISLRPAGAINASAREMANYVQFYLGRGAFGGKQLLPVSAIERMETPTSTYAAREGLKLGYGLSNYTTVRLRIAHGHNGAVDGGLTDFSYLPDEGVGFVVMINSGNAGTLNQISGLIRAYIAGTLPKPAPAPAAPAPSKLIGDYVGWYEPISPRTEFSHGLSRLAGVIRLNARPTGLDTAGFFGARRDFVPVTDRFYRRPADVAPTLALIADHSEGTLLELYGQTYRRIPAWVPWTQQVVLTLLGVSLVSSVVFALVWVPCWLFGKLRGVEGLRVRAMPLLAILSSLGFLLLGKGGSADPFPRLGHLTFWSGGIWLSTMAVALFSVLGLVLAWRWRKRPGRRWVWWHAFVTSVLFTIATCYLTYWGYIGWRTWA